VREREEDMNNEPVAWVQTRAELNNEGAVIAKYTAVKFNSGFEDLPNETPLYTHPAKTLTDEEIEGCYQLWRSLSGDPAKLYQLFKLKEQEK
jgi:hypothetical protein